MLGIHNKSACSVSRWGIACLTLFVLFGCQTTTTGPVTKVQTAAAPLPPDRAPTADEAVGSDECSTRLHDIEGAILMYYVVNKQLPDTLEDLKPFADAGTQLKLACPVSNLLYGYFRGGLIASGTDKRLIVWDAAPSHGGMRWGIVMAAPTPGKPIQADVVKMSDKDFAAFIPPIQ